MSDTYMPDQISVRLITAKGSEEEGWDIFWLHPCGAIDPVREDSLGLHHLYYLYTLQFKLNTDMHHMFIKWDEYNHYGQVIDRRNGKPILELVGENVG